MIGDAGARICIIATGHSMLDHKVGDDCNRFLRRRFALRAGGVDI